MQMFTKLENIWQNANLDLLHLFASRCTCSLWSLHMIKANCCTLTYDDSRLCCSANTSDNVNQETEKQVPPLRTCDVWTTAEPGSCRAASERCRDEKTCWRKTSPRWPADCTSRWRGATDARCMCVLFCMYVPYPQVKCDSIHYSFFPSFCEHPLSFLSPSLPFFAPLNSLFFLSSIPFASHCFSWGSGVRCELPSRTWVEPQPTLSGLIS